MIISHTVTENQRGRELLTLLRRELNLSSSLVRRLKVSGGIFVNGLPVHTNHRVDTGDVVSARVSSGEGGSALLPQAGALDILYEDEALLIVSKPSGIASHPTRSRYTDTLANYAYGYLLAEGSACHLVNRLDRDTSGIVLFAKNGHVKTLLLARMREGGFLKEYDAVVCGLPGPARGEVALPISRAPGDGMRREVRDDGAPSHTSYKVLKSGSFEGHPLSLLRLRLHTGRTHQIRVHMLALGCPVLGDRLYGTDESAVLSRLLGADEQLLHAGRLRFDHPLTGEAVDICRPPARADMRRVMDILDTHIYK